MKSGCLVGLIRFIVNREKLKFYRVKRDNGTRKPTTLWVVIHQCRNPFDLQEH